MIDWHLQGLILMVRWSGMKYVWLVKHISECAWEAFSEWHECCVQRTLHPCWSVNGPIPHIGALKGGKSPLMLSCSLYSLLPDCFDVNSFFNHNLFPRVGCLTSDPHQVNNFNLRHHAGLSKPSLLYEVFFPCIGKVTNTQTTSLSSWVCSSSDS